MLRSTASKEKSYVPFGRNRSPSPPPLPGYNNQSYHNSSTLSSFFSFSKKKRKPSRPRSPLSPLHSNLPSTITRFSPIIQLIIALIIVWFTGSWLFNNPLILFKFKFNDTLTTGGWISHGMHIRKPPLVFVHSSQSASIVWETTKPKTSSGNEVSLRYWLITSEYHNQTNFKGNHHLKSQTGKLAHVSRKTLGTSQNARNRVIHTTLLEDLEPGATYGYEIILSDPRQPPSFDSPKKVYSSHQFTWLGIDPPDHTQLEHLSSTSPKSRSKIDVLHIVVIGDNQFGVKPFRKLVTKFFNIKSYLPSHKSIFGPRQIIHHFYPPPTKPSLLIHAGDAVQDVHNLKQWQTDFWDPLTHRNKLASEVPIVYARGNHDFDNEGLNHYTGGLPKIQVGEMNRSQILTLKPKSKLEIPGLAEADKLFTTFKSHPRDSNSRGSYYSYSPHLRVRILVCDSNLETTRPAHPGSSLSEVDEHERWLLWEMARPEWKEASIRIILVHVPPFVEFWDKNMWKNGHESDWGSYIRTRFSAHFHGMSHETSRYDIPAASLVISGHSHSYSRGYLGNYLSEYYSGSYITTSDQITKDIKRQAKSENFGKKNDLNYPQVDHGVVYVITGGAGGKLDQERVEHWGIYERSIIGKYHFNQMMIDMSSNLLSIDEWGSDWQDSRDKRQEYQRLKIKVYRLIGSQLVCNGTNQSWEAGHYQATDRLIWNTFDSKGQILDRFIIEANSCR